MNQIYIVEWFTAEPYENYSGILKVFDSNEKAVAFANAYPLSKGPYGADPDDYNEGYFVSPNIKTYTVE